MAFTLEKVFCKLRSKYLETDLSSDDEMYIDLSYQQDHATSKKKRRISSDEKENNKHIKSPGKRGRKKGKIDHKAKDQKMEQSNNLINAANVIQNVILAKTEEEKNASKSKLKKKPKKAPLKEFDFREEEFQKVNEEPVTAESKPYEVVEEEEQEDEEAYLVEDPLPEPAVLEDDEDDDDDEEEYDAPPLLVREDPYPEEDEDDLNSSKNLSGDSYLLDIALPASSKATDTAGKALPSTSEPAKLPVPKRKPGRPRKDANSKAAVITQVYNTNRDSTESSKRAAVTVCKYSDDYSEGQVKLDSPMPVVLAGGVEEDEQDVPLLLHDDGGDDDDDDDDKLPSFPHELLKPRKCSTEGELPPPEDDEEDDDIEQDVCIYYKNDNYQSSDEERDEAKAKKDYLNRRHNELFGEIDDLDEDEDKEARDYHSDHHSHKSSKHGSSKRKEKDRKKHKHGDKHHHHHHHHHHKSKSKDGKHHHRKKDKKHTTDRESGRKVLKVEEVYACSEEDPNSRDNCPSPGEQLLPDDVVVSFPCGDLRKETVEEEDEKESLLDSSKDEEDHGLSIDMATSENETSPTKKKKSKHKSKHHSKHSKHRAKEGKVKDGKPKDKETKVKVGKNKNAKLKVGKNKIGKTKESKKKVNKTNNKKRKVPEKKMAAIDALSAATEQTLKVRSCRFIMYFSNAMYIFLFPVVVHCFLLCQSFISI